MSPRTTDQLPVDAGRFEATRWSIVVAAAGANSACAHQALEHLCSAYWYPLYAFVRREGHSVEDAQDLTQGFFARLLEKQDWAGVDRDKGKFRSFLLASMKHYLANEWDRARAQKRGGGQTVLSLDAASAEQRYALEPLDTVSADQLYDRRWALTMLERSLTQVRKACAADGNLELFDEIKGTLAGEAAPQAEIAARLGMTEGALSVAIHRLRKRCRAALRGLIAETVNTDADVNEELQQLLAALRQ